MTLSSPDISFLECEVLFDISTVTPTITLKNLSTQINPELLSWVFEVVSPSGIPIYKGDFDSPDINGNFTSFEIPNAIPLLFGQVEFSNLNGYKITISVKDSEGNVNQIVKEKSICKPVGNTNQNNFGAAILKVITKCQSGKLLVKDESNYVYKGKVGAVVQTAIKLKYPFNAEGTEQSVEVALLPALFPINAEGEGYEIFGNTILDYDLGDYFIVRIRYTFKRSFPIWCGVDICPLLSDIEVLSAMIEKDCSNSPEKNVRQNKLSLINAKLLKVVVGMVEPLCDYDVPKLIEEIKSIGGFTCNCYKPRGIRSSSSVQAGNLNFTATPLCGEELMSWETDEYGNYNLKYKNKSYLFQITGQDNSVDSSTPKAFKFDRTSTDCLDTVYLTIDKTVLASELLTTIKENTYLSNLLNTIIERTNSAVCSSIDGKSVLNLGNCNYTLQTKVGGVNKTLKNIVIAGANYNSPSLALTNDVGIQNFLNSLSAGTFAAVYDEAQDILTITSQNTRSVANITVEVLGGNKAVQQTIQFTNSCGGICAILQSIVNYLDTLKTSQVALGEAMEVCMLGTDNVPFTASDKTNDVIREMNKALCLLKVRLSEGDLGGVVMGKTFPSETIKPTSIPKATDKVMMLYGENYVSMPMKQLAISIFALLGSDNDVKNMFCLNGTCAETTCSPVTNLVATIGATSTLFNWDNVVGAIKYMVSKDGGSNWIPVTGTSYNVTGLTPETNYNFVIYPVYNNGAGIDCQITHNYTTSATVVCAELTGLAATQSNDTVILTWDAVAGATYQWQDNGGSWINAASNNVIISGLDTDIVHNLSVRMVIAGTPCYQSASVSILLKGKLKLKVNGEVNGFTTAFSTIANVPTSTNWGDGITNASKTHTYSYKGDYTIEITFDTPLLVTAITVDGSVSQILGSYKLPNAKNILLNNNKVSSFAPDAMQDLDVLEFKNNGLSGAAVTSLFHDIYIFFGATPAVTVDLTGNTAPSDLTEINAAISAGWTVNHD